MNDKNLFKQVSKMAFLIVLAIVACRLTRGYICLAFGLAGVYYALTNKLGESLCFYLLFPFLAVVNPMIIGFMPKFAMITRLSVFMMTSILVLVALQRKGRHQLPLGGIFVFLTVALISSMGGWFPVISYLKLLNFIVFIVGIWIGTRNLQRRPKDVFLLRTMFLAMIVVLVLGTIFTLPFPAVAYYISLKDFFVSQGVDVAISKLQEGQVMGLLTGMCNHSQTLAPMLSCATAWLLCDMLFLEKKVTKLHGGILFLMPILLYMTRSRLALFVLIVIGVEVYFFLLPRLRLPAKLRSHLNSAMIIGLILIIIGAILSEIQNRTVSRWLRKSDDVALDDRTLGDAVIQSRMSLLDQSLHEFRRNPLLGSGFQVEEAHPILYEMGLITLFSAPIEKGLLPTMVLGETGILGEIAFVLFLVAFWGGCKRKHLVVTFTLFVILLATNMGEATFFSPGGAGGILWMLCVVGGFVIDTVMRIQKGVNPMA